VKRMPPTPTTLYTSHCAGCDVSYRAKSFGSANKYGRPLVEASDNYLHYSLVNNRLCQPCYDKGRPESAKRHFTPSPTDVHDNMTHEGISRAPKKLRMSLSPIKTRKARNVPFDAFGGLLPRVECDGDGDRVVVDAKILSDLFLMVPCAGVACAGAKRRLVKVFKEGFHVKFTIQCEGCKER
jgi:hypothetical protein